MLLGLALVVALGLTAHSAVAIGPTTVTDPNDTGRRLDIRFVKVEPTSEGRTRMTMSFWNRVPPWLLKRRAVRIEMSFSEDERQPNYVFRFWLNQQAALRFVWGELGSNCCFSRAARHPTRSVYTALYPDDSFVPEALWVRGVTTGRLDCVRRDCGLSEGKRTDRTRWAGL
jgi:hypothetical protein